MQAIVDDKLIDDHYNDEIQSATIMSSYISKVSTIGAHGTFKDN